MPEMTKRRPDFAIVGAPKSGTTALFEWLREHHEVYTPTAKELHFFDRNRSRGLDWYLDHFHPAGARVTGEATTTYLGHPTAIEELAAINPGVRLIAVVRDPIDRAWSQYNYGVARSWYTDSFAGMIIRELGALLTGDEQPYGLIHESRYAHNLERAARHVPRGQILVLSHDEVDTAPAVAFARLCRFLGVDETVRPVNLGSRENETRHVRFPRLFNAILRTRLDRALPASGRQRLGMLLSASGYPELDASLREALASVFADDQARLSRFIAAGS